MPDGSSSAAPVIRPKSSALTALFQWLTLRSNFTRRRRNAGDEHDWRTSFGSSCDRARWSESTVDLYWNCQCANVSYSYPGADDRDMDFLGGPYSSPPAILSGDRYGFRVFADRGHTRGASGLHGPRRLRRG